MITSLWNYLSGVIRKLKAIIVFYKNFSLLSLIINVICIRLFWLYGISIFFGIFWCKIISYAFAFYFVNLYKKNEYFFYQNIGLQIKCLWAITLGLDFILFIIILIAIYAII